LGGDGFEMAESFEAPGLMFLRDGGEMAALALLEKPAGAQLSVYRPGELLQNPTSIQNRLSDAFRVEAAAIDEELGADGVLHILGGRSLREVRCECPSHGLVRPMSRAAGATETEMPPRPPASIQVPTESWPCTTKWPSSLRSVISTFSTASVPLTKSSPQAG
jgi:hypothetical protein